jgi:hypothetical protein
VSDEETMAEPGGRASAASDIARLEVIDEELLRTWSGAPDTSRLLVEKAEILQRFGMHTLAEALRTVDAALSALLLDGDEGAAEAAALRERAQRLRDALLTLGDPRAPRG